MAPILIIHHHVAESRQILSTLRGCQILNPVVHLATQADRISYFSNLGNYAEPRFPCLVLIHARTTSEPFADIARSLRAAFQARTVPILITGADDRQQIAQAFFVGITTFLLEPLNCTEILSVLSHIPRLRILPKINGVEISITGTQPTLPISTA
ncbi:MAG TPA: hypothetical protein VF773_07740, partial [Verrucomicrobiae bacterium]